MGEYFVRVLLVGALVLYCYEPLRLASGKKQLAASAHGCSEDVRRGLGAVRPTAHVDLPFRLKLNWLPVVSAIHARTVMSSGRELGWGGRDRRNELRSSSAGYSTTDPYSPVPGRRHKSNRTNLPPSLKVTSLQSGAEAIMSIRNTMRTAPHPEWMPPTTPRECSAEPEAIVRRPARASGNINTKPQLDALRMHPAGPQSSRNLPHRPSRRRISPPLSPAVGRSTVCRENDISDPNVCEAVPAVRSGERSQPLSDGAPGLVLRSERREVDLTMHQAVPALVDDGQELTESKSCCSAVPETEMNGLEGHGGG